MTNIDNSPPYPEFLQRTKNLTTQEKLHLLNIKLKSSKRQLERTKNRIDIIQNLKQYLKKQG